MDAHTRYRVEEGRSCIDLKVRHSRQLFDTRDPAPFRARDLDADAVEYLLAAAQEIPRKRPLAVVVWILEKESLLAPDVIAEAVRAHFIGVGEQLSSDSNPISSLATRFFCCLSFEELNRVLAFGAAGAEHLDVRHNVFLPRDYNTALKTYPTSRIPRGDHGHERR